MRNRVMRNREPAFKYESANGAPESDPWIVPNVQIRLCVVYAFAALGARVITPPERHRGQATSGHEKPQTLTAPNYLRRRRFQRLGVDVTARAGETVHVQTGRASTVQQAQIFEAVSQPRK